jgi:hypothetical protein
MRPNSKKTPIFIDSKPASENREGRRMTYAIIWAEWEGHADASIRPSDEDIYRSREFQVPIQPRARVGTVQDRSETLANPCHSISCHYSDAIRSGEATRVHYAAWLLGSVMAAPTAQIPTTFPGGIEAPREHCKLDPGLQISRHPDHICDGLASCSDNTVTPTSMSTKP